MVQINWTFQAKDDLKSISEYISRDSKKYAKLQILRIRERTKILKSHLEIGKIVPELDNETIRELIDGNYRIIYKVVSSGRVDILTVHHSARDLTNRKVF